MPKTKDGGYLLDETWLVDELLKIAKDEKRRIDDKPIEDEED
jgi:hypothetical protein